MHGGYVAIQTQHFTYYYIIYYHYTKMRVSVLYWVTSFVFWGRVHSPHPNGKLEWLRWCYV
jgi:hypothetical protein